MKFLTILTALILSSAALCARAAERPNILFLFADDWGRYASALRKVETGPSPNEVIKTPNIDRIINEGVLFKNAFVNAPSCTPCRSALLSGRYFFNTGRGAILNGAVWDDKISSFPLLLRDAGYHIGKSYKVWSPGTPVDAPFGRQQFAFEKGGRAPNNFSEEATRMVSEGMTVEAAREKIVAQVQANFDSFLAARKEGQPWMFWFGPTTTHRTWVKGSGKALWGIEPDSLRGKLPKFLPDVPEVREDVADYLGESQAWDAYVGAILARLKESGEWDRTLIVVSGDHGMPGVPAGKCNLYDFGTAVTLAAIVPGRKGGRVVDDYVTLMDLMPTFLDAAGVAKPEKLNGRSLWPQLTAEKSGRIDESRDAVVTGRERHFATAREDNKPYPMRAIRTADFLFIRNFEPERWPMGAPWAVTDDATPSLDQLENNTGVAFPDMDASPTKAWLILHRNEPQWKWHYNFAFGKRPAEELYDLRKDPQQTNNVATDPGYAEIRTKLLGRLMKTLTDAGDPRVTSDPVPYESGVFTEVADKAPRK